MLHNSNIETTSLIPILRGNIDTTGQEIDYKKESDEKLASLFVNYNEEGAFNEIVNRYGEKIYRLSMRITKDPASAEEVLQNVFLKLIEKLGTFREESKLSTWIYSVSANESFMFMRNKNKNYSKEISVEEFKNPDSSSDSDGLQIKDEEPVPDVSVINHQQKEILDKAINELHEEYRIVFQLRDVEGFSNQETADILNLSLPAVKSRILRARNQIRNKIVKYFPEYKN
jgi:RNA polymerase sigma-70 factor (ECF subfamily)